MIYFCHSEPFGCAQDRLHGVKRNAVEKSLIIVRDASTPLGVTGS